MDSVFQQAHMNTIHRLARMSKYNCFVDQIDFDLFPTYLTFVACPMFFSLIWLRLKNGYYRSSGAVLADVELIDKNAQAFNDDHAKVLIFAKKLKKDFNRILKRKPFLDAMIDHRFYFSRTIG